MQYVNEMAKQLNGPVIHSLLETRHNIYNEAEEFIQHRQHLSIQNATEEELKMIGKFLGIPRPYAVIEGETVECSIKFYRLFLENVMFLRTTRSILDLQQMMDQFMPDGLFLLNFIKEGAYKGDIQLTIDAQYAQYKPFFQIAVDAIYNTLPKIHLEDPWDFEEIVLNHVFYSHIASIIDGDWNNYVVKRTTPYSFIFNALSIEIQGGANWTSRTSGTSNNLLFVTYGDGLYIAVGANGTVITSPDAINWTSRNISTSYNLRSVTYGDGLFVAVGSGGTVITSPDAINWTSRTSHSNRELRSVTYGDGLYIAVGANGTVITSPDAINWTSRDISTSYDLYSVTYEDGLFVAVGSGGAVITSPSGKISTFKATYIDNNQRVWACSASKGLFLSTDNGTTFTQQDTGIPTDATVNCMLQLSNNAYLVGTVGGLYVSSNVGQSFTLRADVPNARINDIFKDSFGHIWIAFNGQGIYKSTDNGQTFVQQDTGVPTDIMAYCITQTNDGILWVGCISRIGDGGVYYSTNEGVSFVQHSTQLNATSLMEDTSGRLWLGNDTGLYVKNAYSQSFSSISKLPSGVGCSSMIQRHNGDLWFGTYQQHGLYKSTDGDTFIPISDGVPANTSINSFTLDMKDELYVSTITNGLYKSKETQEFVASISVIDYPANKISVANHKATAIIRRQ